MKKSTRTAGLLLLAALTINAAPSTENTLITRQTVDSCTATKFVDIASIVKKCTHITLSNIHIPRKSKIDLSKLKNGTTVTFAGTTTIEHYALSEDDQKESIPIQIGGSDITVQGAPGAIIDGNGASWWDGFGSNDPDCGKSLKAARCTGDGDIPRISKPNYFIKITKVYGKSFLKDIVLKNYPAHGITISNSRGLTIQNMTLDMRDGDAPNAISAPLPAAHNTDGFGISSSKNIVLKDSYVHNQDDCVAITSGTDIEVSGMTCIGGHGLSIGSVGGKADNTVRNIVFRDSKVINQTNGLRIKSNAETSGLISNITFSGIEIVDATEYGIVIQQDYLNGGPTCKATNGVKIQGVTVKNVHGTVKSGKKNAMGVYVLCGKNTCSDFTFEDVKITGQPRDSCNENASGLKMKGNLGCKDTGANCKN